MSTSRTVTIARLGHHGDGIAEDPVFVPRTLPGEVVEGEVTDGRMSAPRIIAPSPDRVKPPCRHYKSCGGCSLQHVRDDFVADWKIGVVRSALEANGLPAPIRHLHTSPPASRRRATFSGKRTKNGATVGFHRAESDVIIAVPDCQVIRPALRDALPLFETLITRGATRKGEVKLTVTHCRDGLDVVVRNAKPGEQSLLTELSALTGAGTIARLTWNGDTVFQTAQPHVLLDAIAVPMPPGAFLQATEQGETALRNGVAEAVGDAARVADLFSGLGTFALPLARRAEVLAVEGDQDLIYALDTGWRQSTGLRHVTTERRDLFRRPLLTDELARFDAVVIDPPRAGAAAQVAEIARAAVPRVAHVSCNPVTFARDAKTLIDAGYTLSWIDVVDQFRWSNHTELVSLFEINRS